MSEDIRRKREKDTRKQGKQYDVTGREKALRQIRSSGHTHWGGRPYISERPLLYMRADGRYRFIIIKADKFKRIEVVGTSFRMRILFIVIGLMLSVGDALGVCWGRTIL